VTDRSTKTAAGRLPGDLTKDELIDRIIRVDHAGEFGAKRIYEGQLAVPPPRCWVRRPRWPAPSRSRK
jgi:ubiquinone biosynthesis monooxygenase Coq7